MVRFSMSFRSIWGWDSCSAGFDDAHVEGWDVAASWVCASEGVCVPVPALDTGLDGMVWLSRVSRRDVMMTCGT